MNKLIHWTLGSFFRTIGRIIAYVAIGFLIALLLSHSSIKKPKLSDIFTDLFFMKVDALELTQDVELKESPYINFSNTNDMTCEWDKCYREIQSTTTNSINEYTFTISNTISNHDYIEIPFSVSQPLQINTVNSSTSTIYAQDMCDRFTCEAWDSNNQCLRWDCTRVLSGQDSSITDRDYLEYNSYLNSFSFTVMLTYTNNTFSYCEVNNNMIVCPLFGDRTALDLKIQSNFKTARQTTALFTINRAWKIYDKGKTNQDIINNQNQNNQAIINNQNQNSQAVINNQNQQTQAINNTLTDSNTTQSEGEASSFFSNFSTTDNGGLSSIITAPLSAIQSLTSSTCSPLVLPLPYINQNLTLPCMRTIYEENFGGFIVIYDVITIGIISYWILVRIFNLVKDFKNPDHDEIEVVDL